MKSIYLILLVAILSGCSDNTDIALFANDAELIAQTEIEEPTLSVKVYKLSEHGERTENSCPQQLYIALSEFGEYPEQQLFITEKADNWAFVKWEKLPKLGEQPYEAEFLVVKEDQNQTEELIIKVDLESISLQ